MGEPRAAGEGLGCRRLRKRGQSQYCSLKLCRVAYLARLEDVCPGWVTLLLGLFKMFVLAWSRCVLGFSRCLPWLGRVASWAFQDVCPGLVTLRLGLSKMFVLAWSRCVLGFPRCLSWLGHVAAMEEFALQKSYENTLAPWVVIWRLSPRLSPDFSSQTRSITACGLGRFCLPLAV